VEWTAQPRQYDFLTASEDVILYGGARGGGKTDAELAGLIADCMTYDGLNTMLLRRDFAELNKPRAAIPRSCEFLQPLADEKLASWRGDEHQWTFANGSVIQFGHLSDSRAIHKYLGAQCDKISIDQAEEIQYDEFNRLRGSVRSTGARHGLTGALYRPRMALTANPGGIGQGWVKALFIDAAPPNTRYWVDTRGDDPVISLTPLDHAQTYRFIPATVYDNQELLDLDPGYIDRLYAVGGALARAWVNGDWSGFAGQFFGEWRTNRHVVAPFAIPQDWPKWHATDYGITNPSCTLWLARASSPGRAPDGHIIRTGTIVVYRERYEVKRTVDQQALKIKLWSGTESYRNQILDPACWGLESNGTSIAEQFAINGVPMARGFNDRVAGWARLRQLLRWCTSAESKACEECIDTIQVVNEGCAHNTFHPGIIVMSHCTNLIRTLPNLVVDQKHPEDCDTKGEDHAPDALRYGIMASDVQGDEPYHEHTRLRMGAR
jgi:phage terminase large subunit